MPQRKHSKPLPEAPFRPIHDRLLVEWEPETERVLSIWLPETARRPGALGSDRFLRIGRVVAAGPGDPCTRHKQVGAFVLPPRPECKVCHGTGRIPILAKAGDRILYDHPSDKEITLEGKQYVILHEEQHVLAILGEPKPLPILQRMERTTRDLMRAIGDRLAA